MTERDPEIIIMLAGLCDAIKRLERAIECSGDDRAHYIEEAAKRRQQVEAEIKKGFKR